MSTRFLFLTAGFGEGHNAAARALAAAAEEAHGLGAARVVDVFALARPRLNAVVRRGYLGLINRMPGAWSSTYAWLDRSPKAAAFTRWLGRETRVLDALIAAEKPAFLCSTYPVYAYMIETLRQGGRRAASASVLPQHFNVVTDSISINSLWWRAGAAGWFVPNEDSAAVLRQGGVDTEKVHVLGFPVDRFFAENRARLAPPALEPGVPPRVLYIINSGTRGAFETAQRLLAEADWDVTFTVGRDDKLRTQLERAAAGRSRPATILGWTKEIPRLLMTHHVVVSKAGGATTQEAIAALCPMIVNQIVPGQEEGNFELLRRHGAGALAQTPDAVLAAVREALADDGRVWRRWRTALLQLARPDAARDIVAAIAARGDAPGEAVAASISDDRRESP